MIEMKDMIAKSANECWNERATYIRQALSKILKKREESVKEWKYSEALFVKENKRAANRSVKRKLGIHTMDRNT